MLLINTMKLVSPATFHNTNGSLCGDGVWLLCVLRLVFWWWIPTVTTEPTTQFFKALSPPLGSLRMTITTITSSRLHSLTFLVNSTAEEQHFTTFANVCLSNYPHHTFLHVFRPPRSTVFQHYCHFLCYELFTYILCYFT